MCACTMAHVWRSEDNLPELVPSSYHVGPGNETQVVRLGTRHLSPLNHLAGPLIRILTLDFLTIWCCLLYLPLPLAELCWFVRFQNLSCVSVAMALAYPHCIYYMSADSG